jgi:hypothetical protein
MHSVKNISERNKIDTQSRADTYVYFKVWMHQVFVKLKKTLKTLSSGQKNPPNPKNPKNPKKPKKPTGLGLKKNRVFSNPACKVLEGSVVRFSAWAPSGYIRRAILFGYCAGIFKLLRSPGINSASQCSLGGRSRNF